VLLAYVRMAETRHSSDQRNTQMQQYRHFQRLKDDVDVAPLLAELAANGDAWGLEQGRQRRAKVQREAAAVPLRGLRASRQYGRRRRDVHESRDTSKAARFPLALAFVRQVAEEFDGRLGRVRLVQLSGGAHVRPHRDRGDYYRQRDRYHLVLRSDGGSVMRAADEQVTMSPGELWWFDNKAIHEAWNPGDGDRVHLIFDLLPRRAASRRGPEPAPTGLEDFAADPDALLQDSLASAADDDELVRHAARLYLVGRQRPEQWQRFLMQKGQLQEGRKPRPIRSAVALLAPRHEPARQELLRRATVWAIEQLEAGHCRWRDLPGELKARGGAAGVARCWSEAQEAG